jgi:hypothetical protein
MRGESARAPTASVTRKQRRMLRVTWPSPAPPAPAPPPCNTSSLVPSVDGGGVCPEGAARGQRAPPPPSRTNWTRLVPSSRTKWMRLVRRAASGGAGGGEGGGGFLAVAVGGGARPLGETWLSRRGERKQTEGAPWRTGQVPRPSRRARPGTTRPAPPPSPPRTKWTRRVPHPVLIGHAASLVPLGQAPG